MIETHSLPQRYATTVRNARHEISVDAPVDKGGGGADLGAHELLEAALAVCINMTVRMFADMHAIPLDSAATRVRLRRPDLQTVCFEYVLELNGTLSAAHREQLQAAARACPVRQTPPKCLEFRSLT